MVKVCINGGSLAGLSTALVLAADGHDVTVVERDPAPPSRDPDRSWETWERRSVRQARQTHGYLPRFRNTLIAELPHVWPRLLEAGLTEHDLAANAPATVVDRSRRPGDEDLVLLQGRRMTLETVLHHAAEDDPRITVVAGTTAKGLITAGDTVQGLATSSGPVDADVVVDCGGPRSASPDWIEDAGGTRPTEIAAEYRIAYWTQWFRLPPGAELPTLHELPATTIGSFTVLRLPADDGWFSITVVAPASDRRLRALSDQATLLRFLRRLPLTRDWLDGPAEPVGDILPMFTPIDSRRRFVVDGRPAMPGITGVGDAVAATNPTLARGATFALAHAVWLRDVLRTTTDPAGVTIGHDALLEEQFEPWWQATVAADQATLASMEAAARGEVVPPDPSQVFRHAGQHDADLWRDLLRIVGVLELPQDVLARPGVLDRVGQTIERVGPPPPASEVDVEALLRP